MLSLIEPSEDEINDLKIDARIVRIATNRLNAELYAINNRLTKIMSDIPNTSREIEIITALHSCEVIFYELQKDDHIYYENALKFMVHVLSFGKLYSILMQMADQVIPHYDHSQ